MSYRSTYYNSTRITEVNSKHAIEIIDRIKEAILNEKIKDLRSALSEAKKSKHTRYPEWLNKNTLFAAYIFAHKNNKLKAKNHIMKQILAKKYQYDGLNLTDLFYTFRGDFNLLFDDFLANDSFNYDIKNFQDVKTLLDEYSSDKIEPILAKRISKYTSNKNSDRNLIIKYIFEKSQKPETAIAVFNTFFDEEFRRMFRINNTFLETLIEVLLERKKSYSKEVVKVFLEPEIYNSTNYQLIMKLVDNKLITEKDFEAIILNLIDNTSKTVAIDYLQKSYNHNPSFITTIIEKNEVISTFLISNHIFDILPESIKMFILE